MRAQHLKPRRESGIVISLRLQGIGFSSPEFGAVITLNNSLRADAKITQK